MPSASSDSDQRQRLTPFAPAVFVFEKNARWGPELRRQLAGQQVLVRTQGSASELARLATRFTSSLILLDLAAHPAACLGVLGSFQCWNRAAKFIAIATPELAGLEWPLREAGVVSLVSDTIRGEQLAQLCLRQLNWRPPSNGDRPRSASIDRAVVLREPPTSD